MIDSWSPLAIRQVDVWMLILQQDGSRTWCCIFFFVYNPWLLQERKVKFNTNNKYINKETCRRCANDLFPHCVNMINLERLSSHWLYVIKLDAHLIKTSMLQVRYLKHLPQHTTMVTCCVGRVTYACWIVRQRAAGCLTQKKNMLEEYRVAAPDVGRSVSDRKRWSGSETEEKVGSLEGKRKKWRQR